MAEGLLAPVRLDAFEPQPGARQITLQLVMMRSLLVDELVEFNSMSVEQAMSKAALLKTLHLEWQDIVEIANLEMFDSAEVLYLQHNRIEVIRGLESMPRLQFLALHSNRIRKVEHLSHLSELEFLDLSDNLIEMFDVKELPESINILNLKGNPCADSRWHVDRLRHHLSQLAILDGVELPETLGAADLAQSGLSLVLEEGALPQETLQGLSAFSKREELQSGVAASIADQIAAYSLEADADFEGFGGKVEGAVSRSQARRRADNSQRPGSSQGAELAGSKRAVFEDVRIRQFHGEADD